MAYYQTKKGTFFFSGSIMQNMKYKGEIIHMESQCKAKVLEKCANVKSVTHEPSFSFFESMGEDMFDRRVDTAGATAADIGLIRR